MGHRRAVYHLSLRALPAQLVFGSIMAGWIWIGPRYWNTGKIEDKVFVLGPIFVLSLIVLMAFRGYVKVSVDKNSIVFSHVFRIFVKKKVKLAVPIRECRAIVVDYSSRSARFNNVYFYFFNEAIEGPIFSGTDAGLARFLAEALKEAGYSIRTESTDSGVVIRFPDRARAAKS